MLNSKAKPQFKQILIFIITDEIGFVWGVAPTQLQARVQCAWFLPRGGKYYIEPQIAYTKC